MSQKLFEALSNFNLDLSLIQQILQEGVLVASGLYVTLSKLLILFLRSKCVNSNGCIWTSPYSGKWAVVIEHCNVCKYSRAYIQYNGTDVV